MPLFAAGEKRSSLTYKNPQPPFYQKLRNNMSQHNYQLICLFQLAFRHGLGTVLLRFAALSGESKALGRWMFWLDMYESAHFGYWQVRKGL